MRSTGRYAAVTVVACITLTACNLQAPHDDSPAASQARLLERRSSRHWASVDAKQVGNDPIRAILRASHLRAAPFIPRERTAGDAVAGQDKPQEQPQGVKKVQKQDQQKSPELVSVRLRGMPMGQAIELLADTLGMNILLSGNLTQTVSVNFPAIAPRAALNAILTDAGLELTDRGGVFGVQERSTVPDLEARTYTIKSGKKLDLEQIQAFLTPELGSVTMDDEGSTMVIVDAAEAHQRVRTFLDLIDQRKPQVLIEAVVMEVKDTDELDWGTMASIQNINIGGADLGFMHDLIPSPVPPFTFEVLADNGDVAFNLSAGRTINKVNLLSNPLLATVSGQEAKLEIIEKVPYVKESTALNTQGNTQTTSFSEVEFKDVGVRLTVTPEVGGDGVIQMRVEPEILELVDFFLQTPVIDERRVSTTVYVRNNETLVIGGLLAERATNEDSKIPILGDIPLLGYLFRSQSRVTEKVELLIFLTPHLISDGIRPFEGFQPQRHFIDEKQRFPALDKLMIERDMGR